ncbi:hypothetical protein RHGRI_008265 [Rhododendron griersonianum]|uniref:Transmembrane protein n=1 Tax=Rhododendron griersonianum TaxID=479676 RepID=A0AAV6L0T8_9ERIC|nr:hypothetical protein RHGRI_026912 [Rhododendron griersonianum]KAG5558271.1 hypothetical protein RHGRI_008265 [Rhododendron griersonianum]
MECFVFVCFFSGYFRPFLRLFFQSGFLFSGLGFPQIRRVRWWANNFASSFSCVWFGLVGASDPVVCPLWLRSCVGLSTVALPWPKLRVPAGVCSVGVVSTPTKEFHFVFLLRGFAGVLAMDYCFGEDRFLCAALITSFRVCF